MGDRSGKGGLIAVEGEHGFSMLRICSWGALSCFSSSSTTLGGKSDATETAGFRGELWVEPSATNPSSPGGGGDGDEGAGDRDEELSFRLMLYLKNTGGCE